MKNFKRKSYIVFLSAMLCFFGAFVACKDDEPISSALPSGSSVSTVSSPLVSQSIISSPLQENSSSIISSISSLSSESLVSSGNIITSIDTSSNLESTEASTSSDSSEIATSSNSIDTSGLSSESSTELFESSFFSETDSSSVEAPHEHNFEESVSKEATCEETGCMLKTCTACGFETSVEIPALGHAEVIDEAVSSTCKEKGKTEGSHCSRCGITLVEQEELPLVGHSYVEHFCQWCQKCSLTFELDTSGKYYICTGSVEEVIRFLKIPAEYKGKPVKKIAEGAFMCRLALIYVALPETIEAIGERAFADCYNITEVYNRSALDFDSTQPFDHGEVFLNAKHVYSEEDARKIDTDEAGFITYENNLIGYCGVETELTIPDNITAINAHVFSTVKNLKSVVISDDITFLDSLTFANCFTLEKVVIGSGVIVIQPYLFGDSPFESDTIEIIFEEKNGWSVENDEVTKIDASDFENMSRLRDYFFEEYLASTWKRE